MSICGAVGAVVLCPHLLPRGWDLPWLLCVVAANSSQLPLLRTARAGPASPLGMSLKPLTGNTYKTPAPSFLSGTNSVEPLLQSSPPGIGLRQDSLYPIFTSRPASLSPSRFSRREDFPHHHHHPTPPDKLHAPKSLSQAVLLEPGERLSPILLMKKLRRKEAESLTQAHTARKYHSRDLNPAQQLWSLQS